MEIVLNTFGTSLNRDNGGFVITNKDRRQRVPLIGIKSIQISKGVQVTSDAILLAIENEIDIIFMDRRGMPCGRIWSYQYGSISTIRKGQVNFSYHKDAIDWIKEILMHKISNQQAMILMMHESEETVSVRDRTIECLETLRNRLSNINEGLLISDVADQIRGIEGTASRVYFAAINKSLPAKYQFEKRTQHPAYDVTNAFLNYGYGILYGRIEGALIKAGIDPYIGLLHRDDYNRPSLVYDVIEIYRIWVEYVVFNLLSQDVITDEFYSVSSDGSFWLERLGRQVLIQSTNDYLEEIVKQNNIKRSRNVQIQIFAEQLAQKFTNYI